MTCKVSMFTTEGALCSAKRRIIEHAVEALDDF